MLQRHNAREANGQFLFKMQLPEEKIMYNCVLWFSISWHWAIWAGIISSYVLLHVCTFFACFFSNPHSLLCVSLYTPTLETWSKTSLSAQGPTSSSACLTLHNLLFDKAIPSHLSYHHSVRCYDYSDQVFFKVQMYSLLAPESLGENSRKINRVLHLYTYLLEAFTGNAASIFTLSRMAAQNVTVCVTWTKRW